MAGGPRPGKPRGSSACKLVSSAVAAAAETRHGRRDGQSGDQPDFDPQARRRADHPVEQPAGERAFDARSGRGWSMRSPRPRPTTASTRSSSPAKARPSSPAPTSPNSASRRSSRGCRSSSTRSRIARSRSSRRSMARRSAAGSRSRSAAITASPISRRSSARPRSSSACFPAPAARSGCRASPASARRSQMCATGNPIGAKEAFDCGLVDRLAEGDLIPHAVAFAEEVRDVRPLAEIVRAAGPDGRMSTRDVFDEFRKENAKRFRGFEAPLKNIEAVEVAYREALRRRRHRRAQAVHGADERRAVGRAALFLLRRAQGEQDRGPARKHRAAADPQGRRDRRRDDGRRHFDELPVAPAFR